MLKNCYNLKTFTENDFLIFQISLKELKQKERRYMKKSFIIVLLIVSAILMSSCTVIVSKDMMGSGKPLLSPEKVEGIWVFDNGKDDTFYFLKIDKKIEGLVHILNVNTRKKNIFTKKFKVRVKELVLKGKSYLFANFRVKDLNVDKEKDKELGKYYLWFRFDIKKDRILLYMPRIDIFRKAIEQGVLKGKTGKDYVRLDSTEREIEDFIKKNEIEKLFVPDSEMIIKRIKKFYINQRKSCK